MMLPPVCATLWGGVIMGRRVRLALLVLACSFAAGCAAEQLKGTPFYTGEYAQSQGPAKDRVNLWPLLYYRRPALSVLWPIGEYVAGEHVAVRPLFSIYGLRKARPVVNVLWPLCRFAPGERNYRVFPAFWGRGGGKPYFVLFPFVWYSKGDHVGLFPLFLRYTEGSARSTHVLWPVFNVKSGWGERGWRIWPFYGQYRQEGHSRRYVMWPLAMSIRDGDERTRWLAPFYFSGRSPGAKWDLVFPVYYSRTGAGGRRTVVTPLYMTSRSGRDWWRAVLPLYYGRRSGAQKSDLLFPFAYRWTDGQARMLLTLPYGFKESGQTRTIYAFPLLSAYSRSPEGKDLWALYHKSWQGTTYWTSVLWPLIGTQSGADSSGNYVRLLYSYSRKGDTKRLQLGPSIGNLSLIGREWSRWGRSWWLFPIFWSDETVATEGLLPIFGGDKTAPSERAATEGESSLGLRHRQFTVFPLVWHSASLPVDESGRMAAGPEAALLPAPRTETMVLPLWRSWRKGLEDGRGTGEKGFWLLGWLYDSKKRVTQRSDGSGLDTYVRRRVLWRLMHYERENDQVSLDVFPGITYDRTPGESKTFSLLWRVFRYEWDRETGTKVHVLFIPFGG
jgi:hypothetical protein